MFFRKKKKVVTAENLAECVTAGLTLMSVPEADDLIGGKTKEYETLLNAMQAEQSVILSVFVERGWLTLTSGAYERFTQHLAICLQLLHFAHALGIKEERNR